MTKQQPEALRLADELLALHGPTDIDQRYLDAAAELRRLHRISHALLDALWEVCDGDMAKFLDSSSKEIGENNGELV